jgi:hypothetical protein
MQVRVVKGLGMLVQMNLLVALRISMPQCILCISQLLFHFAFTCYQQRTALK